MNAPGDNSVRILVVDDDAGTRLLLQALITKSVPNVELELAVDGNDALKKARATKPQVILMDYMLPRMDGLKVTRFIKGDAKLKQARIIMMTASDGEALEAGARDCGADCLVSKPLEMASLRAKIEHYLAEIRSST